MTDRTGTYLVKMSSLFVERFAARTDDGLHRCTIEMGEPDADGIYCPIITKHHEPLPVFAERDSLERRCAELEAALRATMEQWRKPDESHREYFERQAERFYRETGFVAPGKSVPLEMGGYDEDARQAKWVEFYERPYSLMVAALSGSPSALRALLVEAAMEGVGVIGYGGGAPDREMAEAIADRILGGKDA